MGGTLGFFCVEQNKGRKRPDNKEQKKYVCMCKQEGKGGKGRRRLRTTTVERTTNKTETSSSRYANSGEVILFEIYYPKTGG